MTWIWAGGVVLAALTGVVVAAVAAPGAPVHPLVLGTLVGGLAAAYPAWRAWRIFKGTAAAVEWLAFEVGPGNETTTVTALAVPRLNVPPVSLPDVPADLAWAAQDLLTRLVEHLVHHGRGFSPGTVEARLCERLQQFPHVLVLRTEGGGLVVGDADGGTGFPRRLLAFHLDTLAEPLFGMKPGVDLLERSIRLWPGEPAADARGVDEPVNANNAMAHAGLGHCAYEMGRADEAYAHFRAAVVRAPAWMRRFQQQVRDEVAAGKLSADEPRTRFWMDLDVDATHADILRGKA